MSFILDALKKSENERQQQQSADFAAVPSGSRDPRAPRWLWVLGLLLVVNLVVVVGLLLRPDAPASPKAEETLPAAAAETPGTATAPASRTAPVEPAVAATDAGSSFQDRVAEARETRPAPAVSAATTDSQPEVADLSAAAPVRQSRSGPGFASLPSLEELQLNGTVNLPPLHIDLHVYNESPSRRFVSINMNKYHENDRMQEGPLVREITREGVILEYQGKAFALLQ